MNLRHLLPPLLLSLAMSGCVSMPTSAPVVTAAPTGAPARCQDCGRVERIDAVHGVRATAQGGAVLSGVVGGVVASPAKTASPVTSAGPPTAYRVIVRMLDGRRLELTQNTISADLRIGAPVRIMDGRVVMLR